MDSRASRRPPCLECIPRFGKPPPQYLRLNRHHVRPSREVRRAQLRAESVQHHATAHSTVLAEAFDKFVTSPRPPVDATLNHIHCTRLAHTNRINLGAGGGALRHSPLSHKLSLYNRSFDFRNWPSGTCIARASPFGRTLYMEPLNPDCSVQSFPQRWSQSNADVHAARRSYKRIFNVLAATSCVLYAINTWIALLRFSPRD